MNDPILELLRTIVHAIVDTPSLVVFERKELDDKVVYFVIPRSGEAGQIIGKKGFLAANIRGVIKAAANRSKEGKRVYMDVIDLDKEPF